MSECQEQWDDLQNNPAACMTVGTLVEILNRLPQDTPVAFCYETELLKLTAPVSSVQFTTGPVEIKQHCYTFRHWVYLS